MLIWATDNGGDNGRENGLNKKKLKNLILESLFTLLIFKIDFDNTRHFAALLVGRSRDRFLVVSLGIFFRGSFRQNHVP